MKIRILSEADCRAALDMRAAIDIQKEAFTLLSEGRSVQGLRSFAGSDNPPALAIFNPCFLRAGAGYGIKVIADFRDNEQRGIARMNGLVCLFDGLSGRPQAVLAAGYLTDLRTGAGTALAARHLARRDSKVATIIGAGRVACNQLAALVEIFELETIHVCTRSPWRGADFARRLAHRTGRLGPDIQLTFSHREREHAVRNSDVVIAATTSASPVISGEWLRPGTFVAAVGAHKASMREVDTHTIRRASRRVIDSRSDCLDHAGDLIIPIGEGVIRREHVAEIAELVNGTSPGRISDGEITFYKSIGAPIQDLITAQHMLRRAEQTGIGVEIEIGGDTD